MRGDILALCLLCLIFLGTSRLFSKVAASSYFPPAKYENRKFSCQMCLVKIWGLTFSLQEISLYRRKQLEKAENRRVGHSLISLIASKSQGANIIRKKKQWRLTDTQESNNGIWCVNLNWILVSTKQNSSKRHVLRGQVGKFEYTLEFWWY